MYEGFVLPNCKASRREKTKVKCKSFLSNIKQILFCLKFWMTRRKSGVEYLKISLSIAGCVLWLSLSGFASKLCATAFCVPKAKKILRWFKVKIAFLIFYYTHFLILSSFQTSFHIPWQMCSLKHQTSLRQCCIFYRCIKLVLFQKMPKRRLSLMPANFTSTRAGFLSVTFPQRS